MPWARLDDSIYDNRKLLECAPASRWLYIAAICYCRRNQTAGSLTRGQMASLLAGQKLRVPHVKPLLTHGLLVDTDYGYEIPAYEEFNPLTSTERVRKHREAKRDGTLPDVTEAQKETPLARTPRVGHPQPVPVPIVISSPSNVLPLTREAQVILNAHEELGGRSPSPKDVQDAEGMVAEFQIATAEQMAEAIYATHQWRREHGRTPIVRAVGWRETLRRANDLLRDGGQKPRPQPESRAPIAQASAAAKARLALAAEPETDPDD